MLLYRTIVIWAPIIVKVFLKSRACDADAAYQPFDVWREPLFDPWKRGALIVNGASKSEEDVRGMQAVDG
jgi:hypothetical protein